MVYASGLSPDDENHESSSLSPRTNSDHGYHYKEIPMKAFYYNNDLYIRAVPSKNLFRSTMVHEVINRGDIFAVRVKDQLLTIILGTAEVSHVEFTPGPTYQPEAADGLF